VGSFRDEYGVKVVTTYTIKCLTCGGVVGFGDTESHADEVAVEHAREHERKRLGPKRDNPA